MAVRLSDLQNKFRNDLRRNVVRMIEETVKPSVSREKLFNGVFKIGKTVQLENQKWEIIDVRTNYVVLINASGEVKNAFVEKLTQLNEKIKFPINTFKGVSIPEELVSMFDSNPIPEDIVCCIKGLRAYTEGKFDLANKNFERAKMDNTQRKMNAIKLIADALEVKLSSTDKIDDAVKKVKNKLKSINLTTEQKQILDVISRSLKKQGIEL